MGTGGGRGADKPHFMEKECPSGLVGNGCLIFKQWGLGIFCRGVRMQDYQPAADFPGLPPPHERSAHVLGTYPTHQP